ncbi:MAG: transglutaminase domain-containing protein, partial [Porcipelethomonas sp.]
QLYKCCEMVDNSNGDYTQTPYASYGELDDYDCINEITVIFMYDHPEYFWLANSSHFLPFYGVSFDVIDEFQDGTTRQYAKGEIEAVEQDYIDGALQYATEYDMAKYLHDELLRNVSYNKGDWDQSIASVFLQNETVCAGYAKAYELLCNAVGIDAVMITSIIHGWNAVKIDGNWYLVDVTNDHSDDTFFLISDSSMKIIDRGLGAKYQLIQTVNGVTKTYEFYMHDIDYLTYVNYYDDFPKCNLDYGEDEPPLIISTGIAGDANGDGVLNVRDAAFIAAMIAIGFGDLLPESADFNEDHITNVRDAAAIAKYLATGVR